MRLSDNVMPGRARAKLLTRDEELVLFAELRSPSLPGWKRERARTRLVDANTGLVAQFARHYRQGSASFEDLAADGLHGLAVAIDKYDPTRGARFATLAVWWIHAYISKGALSAAHAVKIDRSDAERKALFLARKHAKPNDGTPLGEILAAMLGRVSTDSPLGDENKITLLHMLPASGDVIEEYADAVELSEQTRALREAMGRLPEIQRDIVQRRFLNETRDDLKAIGDDWGLSRERIRQLEKMALEGLARLLGTTREHREILDDHLELRQREARTPSNEGRIRFLRELETQIRDIRTRYPAREKGDRHYPRRRAG